MEHIEKAWFYLGRAFSNLDFENQIEIYMKFKLIIDPKDSNSGFDNTKFKDIRSTISDKYKELNFDFYEHINLMNASSQFDVSYEIDEYQILNENAKRRFEYGRLIQELNEMLTVTEICSMINRESSTIRRAIDKAVKTGKLIDEVDCRKSSQGWLVRKTSLRKFLNKSGEIEI